MRSEPEIDSRFQCGMSLKSEAGRSWVLLDTASFSEVGRAGDGVQGKGRVCGRRTLAAMRFSRSCEPAATPDAGLKMLRCLVSFFELVRQLVRSRPDGMTPQQLRDQMT